MLSALMVAWLAAPPGCLARCPALRLELPPEVSVEALGVVRETKTPQGLLTVLRWGELGLLSPVGGRAPGLWGSGRYADCNAAVLVEVREPECTAHSAAASICTGSATAHVAFQPSGPQTPADQARLLAHFGAVEASPESAMDLAAQAMSPPPQPGPRGAEVRRLPGPLRPQRRSFTRSRDGRSVELFPGAAPSGETVHVGRFELTPLRTLSPRSPIGLLAVRDLHDTTAGVMPFNGLAKVLRLSDGALLLREREVSCGGTPCWPRWAVLGRGRLVRLHDGIDDVTVRGDFLLVRAMNEDGALETEVENWVDLLAEP